MNPKKFECVSAVMMENYKNCIQIVWVCFGCKTLSSLYWWAQLSTFPVPVVPRPEKVVKIWWKHFSTVLARKDKNCTPKSVGMFQALNRVICSPFLTFPTSVVLRPEKVVKIRLKHFSTFLMGNYKNCTANCEGMFWVPNVVIWAQFFIFDCAGGARGPEKSSKFHQNSF